MRPLVAVLSLVIVLVLFAEFFSVFLLPRRVKRDPKIVRGTLRALWIPYRAFGSRLSTRSADTFLGIFGPFGLLFILTLLSTGLALGYAGLAWAFRVHIGNASPTAFGHDLYFTAATLFSASTPAQPRGTIGEILQVLEAATGYAVLFISIGYLPALFQAFSRRETAVSRLDPRAGSPPSAGALLQRSGERGGWRELDLYLREWEGWTAELMETHLSYPILGYFRSQHVNQNWLAALVTVVDACAYSMAYGPAEENEASELTFRIGRHALADLAYAFSTRRIRNDPALDRERLPPERLRELRERLEGSGLHVADNDDAQRELAEIRSTYEPYAIAISFQLALDLPDWLPPDHVRENWRLASRPTRGEGLP